MGLREGFWRLLSRGEAPETNDEDWCELVTVAGFEAPLVVNELSARGIETTEQDSFNVATRTLSDVTVLVRRADLVEARRATS